MPPDGDITSPNSCLPRRACPLHIGRSGTKAAGEFTFLANEDTSFLDARVDGGDTRFYLIHNYNSKFMCGYNQYIDTKSPITLGEKYYVETELNTGSQTMKVSADGSGATNTIYSANNPATVNTGIPLYLFCCNYGGDGWVEYPCKGRCHGLKIWQDGVLKRDYRPCLKNGVAGLYDDVTKRIYYSSGIPFTYETRKAVKPKEVIFVDYIESDGNNTLDTYVPARSGTRAKGEMAWTQAGDISGASLPGTSENMRSWKHEMYRYLEYTGSPNVFILGPGHTPW